MDENQNISISPGQKNLIKSYTCFPKKNFREIGSFHLTSFLAWTLLNFLAQCVKNKIDEIIKRIINWEIILFKNKKIL